MTITAKYAGTCTACHQPIAAGQQVEWERGVKGARHTHCAAAGGVTPSPRAPYARRSLSHGDIYTSRRTGERAVFGCAACSRLGHMCERCRFDEDDN